MAGSPERGRVLGLQSSFVKGVVTALAAVLVLAMGFSAAFGVHGMQSSGICFADPLGRTSIWPYDPSTNALTLAYHLDARAAGVYQKQYDAAARTAFRAWSRAWPVLHFEPVRDASDAQIEIRSGRFGMTGKWFDHAGLTVPDVDVFGCSLTRAVIEINDSYLVHNGFLEYPPAMLKHLLLHEIGHALGLRHVYGRVASVMIPTSAAYRYAKPQPFDVRTLAGLYPSSHFHQLPEGSTAVSSPPTVLEVGYHYRSVPLGLTPHR
jgi:hypothetical protein